MLQCIVICTYRVLDMAGVPPEEPASQVVGREAGLAAAGHLGHHQTPAHRARDVWHLVLLLLWGMQ